MAHIFIDESGQFASGNGKYFVVASFIIGSPRRTEKSFMGWRASHFPKKMRNLSEIKWSANGIDDDLRLKTLRHIADLDVRIRYVYVEICNIPEKRMRRQGDLYTEIIGDTIEMYFPPQDKELYVICDQKNLKGLTQMQFKNRLMARLVPKVPPGTKIEIEMIDSTTNTNVQIADWIVGALAWYHEKKLLGEECYAILKNNLLDEGKELFKRMWSF